MNSLQSDMWSFGIGILAALTFAAIFNKILGG
jgi:hypothetical protein